MRHIHRFFIPALLKTGKPVRLEPEDAFHAVRVLRLKSGDEVELADSEGQVFTGIISSRDRGKSSGVEVIPQSLVQAKAEPGNTGLTVFQALPSGRKMDLVVEKLSEIGVHTLVPVLTEKSVKRGDPRKLAEKTDRWRRVARAAAAQAKRTRVMVVAEPAELAQWVLASRSPLLVLATEVEGMPLGEAAGDAGLGKGVAAPDPGTPSITLVVGPEAGFSPGEIDMLRESGARFTSLGPRLLKTETAALAAAVVVMHRMGLMG